MSVIDLTSNGFSYETRVSVGEVTLWTEPAFGRRLEGEVGDKVQWMTPEGVAHGEVIGAVIWAGIPVTRVRVTGTGEAPHGVD